MKVQVDPANSLIDSPVKLAVKGAEPGTELSLTISTTDAAGNRWISEGNYQLGEDHLLVLADPMKPWWDMTFATDNAVPVAFIAPDDGLTYEIEISDGAHVAQTKTRRLWGCDVDREVISGPGWQLWVYRPKSIKEPVAGVVVIPGSTGAASMAGTAALLASHGYVSGVLAYIQEPGLPESFCQIPIENVNAGLRAFASLAEVDSNRLAIHATSVGTTVALSVLAHEPTREYAKFKAVVLVAPSNVVWQALGDGGRPPEVSSLTLAGDDIPYLPMKGSNLIPQIIKNALLEKLPLPGPPRSTALATFAAYQPSLSDVAKSELAAIPVERIDGGILAIAGTDDKMWPAEEMARSLIERRKKHRKGKDDKLVVCTGAGHFIRPPGGPTTVDRNDDLISGGSPEATAQAQRDAWSATLAFLDARLRK